jgi:hypothetical protein
MPDSVRLGYVALGEVRRWANTCDDEGGRLYALPLADAYEELCGEVEKATSNAVRVLTSGCEKHPRPMSWTDFEVAGGFECPLCLHAEVERLRRALEHIATAGPSNSAWFVTAARAALTGEEG